MTVPAPVIWLYGHPPARQAAEGLLRLLKGRAQPLTLGAPGPPGPDLELKENADLALVLESCPLNLRPQACLNLEPKAPAGLDCLPCLVLGLNGGQGLEGDLPSEPGDAVAAILAAASQGLAPAWLERMQVGLPLLDLLGRFRSLASQSPLNFEIGLDAAALDTVWPNRLPEARLLLKGRRLTAHLPFTDLAPGSDDPQVAALAFRRLMAAGDLAVALGAEQAVLHLGFEPRLHRDQKKFAERLGWCLAPMVERLRAGGCRLVLENAFEIDPQVLVWAREHLARHGQVGFCLDVGHALAFSSTPLADWWEAMAPYLWEVHLHDNDTTDDLHWPCGWGAADWAFLGKALKGLTHQPILTLEPHREPHLWASLRGLKRLWGEVFD
jgi:sugar phosphate isomerase/epimerase